VADISVSERAAFGLASVLPRRGVGPDALNAALGFAVVSGPVASQGEAIVLLGTGPGQWLAYGDAAPPNWAEVLGETLAGVAAVVDQSSAYTVLQIAGADARRLLQKGLPVDLATFVPGAVAVSAIAHLGVILYYADPDCFHVFVFRSFTGSFREWLDASIAAL